jgi:hypothetical protein
LFARSEICVLRRQTSNMSRASSRPNRSSRGQSNRPKLLMRGPPPVSRSFVHKIVMQELKKEEDAQFIDAITSSPQSITTSGTIGALFNISQGIQDGQRIGDNVQVLSLTIGTLDVYAYNSDLVSHVRMIIFQWIPNIADFAPTVADILQTPTTNSCFSLLNVEHSPEYVVLYDKLWKFIGSATVLTEHSDKILKNVRIKKPPKPICYESTSSSGSSGTICMLTIADSTTSPSPAIQYAMRAWYKKAKVLDGSGIPRLVA